MSDLAQQKRDLKKKKQLNPFEVHINRDKQKVLGRKSKNDRGLPGISRAKAINRRKQSLLQEYKLKNKDNLFLDKRIGEKNSGMSAEDKAIARFAKERTKAYKKSIFNLHDEEILTHRGQTLEEIEKFDDPRSDDEYSDNGNTNDKLDRNFVEDAHFGGGTLSRSDSALSRKNLIDQLIAESKKRKAEKQKIREQTIDLTEKLDSEWKDLLPIISASKKSSTDDDRPAKADAYDIAVRQLKFEARGNPTEKLKSEEEIAKEEKETLETLEADRLARMKGFVSSAGNKHRPRSADDLNDDFLTEPITEDGNDNNDVNSVTNDDSDNNDEEKDDEDNNSNEDLNEKDSSNNEDSDNEDNSQESEENLSDLKESESSGEDEHNKAVEKRVRFTDTTSEDNEQTKQSDEFGSKSILKQRDDTVQTPLSDKTEKQEIVKDLLKRKEIMEKARKELPYTYNAPDSFEELEELLENHNADYQSVIVDRIIKCNHPRLDSKNKEAMSNLFVYLLQYVNNCAFVNTADSLIKCFDIFDRLCPYFYDLAHMNPEIAQTSVQELIKEKYKKFENKKTYPGMDTLIFFKLVSLLFPTSDFRHPVVTPCLAFMSQILLRARIKRCRSDISKGLFMCTLVLEYMQLNKRFAPSVINFLRGVIYTATPADLTQNIKVIPPFKRDLKPLVIDQTEVTIDLENSRMSANDLICENLDDDFKIRALLTAVNLVREFKNQLQELEAVYSIFEPILKLLEINKFKNYPSNVRKRIKEVRKELALLRSKKLEYIVLEKKRPKPLRTYEPKIMTIYDGKKHKLMSREKAEREKLLHKYKREFKGAIREIRRDRDFLAKVQIAQQVKSDAERKRKVNEIFGEAAMQQSELKKMRRKK